MLLLANICPLSYAAVMNIHWPCVINRIWGLKQQQQPVQVNSHAFVFNLLLVSHSLKLDGALANEIKHDHSSIVIVFRPKIRFIIQGLCIFTTAV